MRFERKKLLQNNFLSFADSLNPKAINIDNGNEEYILNSYASHIVLVMDKDKKQVLVIGSNYALKKYTKSIIGKFQHSKITTLSKYINNLFS